MHTKDTSLINLHRTNNNKKLCLNIRCRPQRISHTVNENINHYLCVAIIGLKLQSQQKYKLCGTMQHPLL